MKTVEFSNPGRVVSMLVLVLSVEFRVFDGVHGASIKYITTESRDIQEVIIKRRRNVEDLHIIKAGAALTLGGTIQVAGKTTYEKDGENYLAVVDGFFPDHTFSVATREDFILMKVW